MAENKFFISNDGLNAYGTIATEESARNNKANLDDYTVSLISKQQAATSAVDVARQQGTTEVNTAKENALEAIQRYAPMVCVTEAEYPETPTTGTMYFRFPSDCTVTFDANGGTGTMESQAFDSGKARNLRANSFTAPSGKVFDSWNTEAGGGGTRYEDQQSVTFASAGSLTLYAQWIDE